jgi:hypothetical protein
LPDIVAAYKTILNRNVLPAEAPAYFFSSLLDTISLSRSDAQLGIAGWMVRRFFGLAVGLQVVDNGQTSAVLEGRIALPIRRRSINGALNPNFSYYSGSMSKIPTINVGAGAE